MTKWKLLLAALTMCACATQGQAQTGPPSSVMAGQYGSSYFGVSVNAAGDLITTSGAGSSTGALTTPPGPVLAVGVYTSPVSLGASPYVYTAPTAGIVTVTGGTVSALTLTHAGHVTSVTTNPATLYVSVGDMVTITYSAAPTVTLGTYVDVSVNSTGALVISGSGGGFTLTTTGTSGAATYTGGVLNIPVYSGGGATPGGTTGAAQYNNAGTLGGLNGTGLEFLNGAGAPSIATSAQLQTVIGGGVYDAAGAAASQIATLIGASTLWTSTNTFTHLKDLDLAAAAGQCLQGATGGALVGVGAQCSNPAAHLAGAEVQYTMLPSTISGSTILDISGNANNATECSDAPTSTSEGLVFSDGSACVNYPSSLNNLRTFEYAININANTANNGAYVTFFGPSGGNSQPVFFLSAYQNCTDCFGNFGFSDYQPSPNTATPTASGVLGSGVSWSETCSQITSIRR